MFLRTLILLKFTGIIAHLVTNSIAFGEFLRVDPSIQRRYVDLYPPPPPSSASSPSSSFHSTSPLQSPSQTNHKAFHYSPTSSATSSSPNQLMASHIKKAPKSKYPFYNKPHIFIQYVLSSELFNEEGRIITIHALTWDSTPTSSSSSSGLNTTTNRYSTCLICPSLNLPMDKLKKIHNEEAKHMKTMKENNAKLGITFKDHDGFENKGSLEHISENDNGNDNMMLEAKHLLSHSLSKLFDCDISNIALHEVNQSNDEHDGTNSSLDFKNTLNATIKGVNDHVIGNAVSTLINMDLQKQKLYDVKFNELNEKIKNKNDKIMELKHDISLLKVKPENLGKIAEVLYISNNKTVKILSELKLLQNSNNNNNSSTSHIKEKETILKNMVMTLSSLLKAANNRVAKALDQEEKLKESLGRLDTKVQQIITHNRNSSSKAGSRGNEHINLLKELVSFLTVSHY